MLFPRPTTAELYVERIRLDGETCPECGGGDIRGYPVLRVSGWALVARCQGCLAVLRDQAPLTPFGFTYLPYSAYLKGL